MVEPDTRRGEPAWNRPYRGRTAYTRKSDGSGALIDRCDALPGHRYLFLGAGQRRHGARWGPSGRLVGLLAAACGLTVANLYYAQPLLSSLRGSFGIDAVTAGALITITQLGYAAGMVLLVPLGDRMGKRRLVAVLLAVTTAALAVSATAPVFPVLLGAALVVGLTSVVAQILVPLAADLAPEQARGRIVGRVMSGLLVGILLSRTVGSLVAEAAGWRVVYLASAALMAVLAVVLRLALPERAPTTDIPYGRLLASTARLLREHAALRRRALYQAAMFGAFSAFWTTVSYLLTGPGYHYSELGIGLFALVGAAGAAVAPLAGRWADHGWGRAATGAAFAVGAAAFAVGDSAGTACCCSVRRPYCWTWPCRPA